MPTITVTLTKEQLKNNFEEELNAIARMGILDSLEYAVQKRLNKSFSQKTSQDVKEALI
jgi:hypothetical protein